MSSPLDSHILQRSRQVLVANLAARKAVRARVPLARVAQVVVLGPVEQLELALAQPALVRQAQQLAPQVLQA